MIRRTVLDTFVRTKGYEVVEKYGISKASEISGLSRPTIYTILKEHPTEPKRVLPKYVGEWEESVGRQKFIELIEGKIKGKNNFKGYLRVGLVSWKDILNRKDPVSWVKEDFQKVWRHEGFRDSETGVIEYNIAVRVRKWMLISGQNDLLDSGEFSPTKRPKGKKKMWFLEDEELERLIRAIDRPDLLILLRLGIESGGRLSSLKKVKPRDVNGTHQGILMFEPKVNDYVLRYFNECSMRFFKRYIADFSIQPEQLLCAISDSHIDRLLAAYGEKARLCKTVSSHIMKHTFVSQAGHRGVSVEIISEQTGTDPNTLREFYAGIKEEKIKHELLGEPMRVETFWQWVQKFEKLWVEQYERIKSGLGLPCGSASASQGSLSQ